jgi:hypothetical protein
MGQNPSSLGPNQSAANFCVYFNRAIPQAGEFSFCPWCGSKVSSPPLCCCSPYLPRS